MTYNIYFKNQNTLHATKNERKRISLVVAKVIMPLTLPSIPATRPQQNKNMHKQQHYRKPKI